MFKFFTPQRYYKSPSPPKPTTFAGTPFLTLGSQNARRAIFIPKVHRKIHFPAGYPLTLGSQNARRAIFIPKVSRK